MARVTDTQIKLGSTRDVSSTSAHNAWQTVVRRALRQHGVISREQALAAGLSRGAFNYRVETKDLVRMHPSVYVLVGARQCWEQRLIAACLHAGPDALVSHQSAAALWKLDGYTATVVEITSTSDRRDRGVILHRSKEPLPRLDRTHIGCIPVTTVARTLLDLGAVLPPPRVEKALDGALRKRLTSLNQLEQCLKANGGNGRRGAALLRRLLSERDPSSSLTESPLEEQLLRILRKHGLPTPVCQHKIFTDGRLVARVDFAYPELKIAIEADGYIFHSEKSDWEKDRERDAELLQLDWLVLRVTRDQMENRPNAVAERIRRAREQRERRLW
ncbi:MAG: type IV toxin-antitoxin system AbiEi family antitoxin domain-containing protein [Actinomycetota bacterium]